MPGNLKGLLKIKNYKYTFDLKFLELILDITEAVDYRDSRYVKMITELIARGYLIIYKVSLDIIKGYSTLRKRYDKVLTRRVELLIKAGFRLLFIKNT
jgi:hypothetical protein